MKTVAIIGKPNVGKSTLFNRIINKKKSIVHDEAGVTRDRIYDEAEWLTRKFEIIDTGGFSSQKLTFQQNINEQVMFAIDEADIIIFLVSCKTGLESDDFLINKFLKRYKNKKKVILVANKCEYLKDKNVSTYYSLGFGEPILISSSHGVGIGDLLDKIISYLETLTYSTEKTNNYSFCVIGRPNVGKSSLINAFLNENKVIVSDVAGSTRDATDSKFRYHNEDFIITDTAGIKRKGRIKENLDKFAYVRAERAISKSKLILLMLDGSEDFKEQDEVIGGLCYNANIPTIIVVNKIDLIKDFGNQKISEIKSQIRKRFKFLDWAPILFISSKEKLKINKIMETIIKIREKQKIKINTSLLNQVILQAQMIQQAPIHKGHRLNISYATQIESQIPSFVIFCNDPKYLHFSYSRYIENKIRTSFGLDDVPILLYWKSKNSKERNN